MSRFAIGVSLRSLLAGSLFAGGLFLSLNSCTETRSPQDDSVELECTGCNLVLISLDTLRADHLGCYGYPRPTSPNIDRFAGGSLLFEQAFSTSHHTADSHMSIFTSLYPSVHGVRNASDRRATQLPSSVVTLAQALRDHGYRTAGFHGGGNLSPIYGFDRGFEVYEETTNIADTVDWILKRSGERFFAFQHTYRVHDPYLPAPPYNNMFGDDSQVPFPTSQEELDKALDDLGKSADNFSSIRKAFWSEVDANDPLHIQKLIDLYDGEIRQADEEMAPLFAALRNLDRPTVIAITSDHGEEFQEHGLFRHHKQLYNTLLRVPLILHIPGVPSGRISKRVSLVDLTPTLLQILVAPPLVGAQGRSFLATLNQTASPREVFGEKIYNTSSRVKDRPELPGNKTLIAGVWKLVYHRKDGILLFNLDEDPGETENVADSYPDKVIEMMTSTRQIAEDNESLRDGLMETDEPTDRLLDATTRQQLEALGYLE